MNQHFWNYLRRDKKAVKGWLQRVDAEIIGALITHQRQHSIHGGCAEIGVHHGKSFIPLCLSLADTELALCIDIFEDQSKNLDDSGKGDMGHFQANLAKFGIDAARIRVFKGSSEEVTPTYITEQVGPVRFFSVDGGHWKSIVMNDLRLAEATLSADGIIALDDYYRAEWPDVTAGYALWQETTASDIVPFAIGSNKLYLCRKAAAPGYRAALQTPFLKHYLSKTYESQGATVDSYRVELVEQDEASVAKSLGLALKVFRPNVFQYLMQYRSR